MYFLLIFSFALSSLSFCLSSLVTSCCLIAVILRPHICAVDLQYERSRASEAIVELKSETAAMRKGVYLQFLSVYLHGRIDSHKVRTEEE